MRLLLMQHVYSKEEQQQQTNKLENFYSKKETNKLYLRNHKISIKKRDYNLLNIC
jgi:hypothetical protein